MIQRSQSGRVPAVRPSLGLAQVEAFASVLDGAEGRAPGHAARVALIARACTDALLPVGGYLPNATPHRLRRTATLAGLLHDAGVPLAAQHGDAADAVSSPRLGPDERAVFATVPLAGPRGVSAHSLARDPLPASVQTLLHRHVHAAHDFLTASFFPPGLVDIVAASHENWDRSGYPRALSGERIPAFARILRAADLLEAHITLEPNPFRARASAPGAVARWRGREIDPLVASALDRILAGDDFWLRLHDSAFPADPPEEFPASSPADAAPSPTDTNALPGTVAGMAAADTDWRFAAAVAALVDHKTAHPAGRVLRVARTVRALAATVLPDAADTDTVTRAALWNDVGLLALPQGILRLPDLLSLEQMESVHRHPRLSADVVAGIPGLEGAANWVVAHHDRLDGKGYPDGLRGAEIPLPAAIFSLADAYIAVTSDRPHRSALSDADALQAIRDGADRYWSSALVDAFLVLHRENRLSAPLPLD